MGSIIRVLGAAVKEGFLHRLHFAENQLYPFLVGLSPLAISHPRILRHVFHTNTNKFRIRGVEEEDDDEDHLTKIRETPTLSSFSLVSIRNVLHLSTNLALRPDHFSKFLHSMKLFGFTHHTINKLLESFPTVIIMDHDVMRHKLHFFLSIGIQWKDLDRIFSLFPGVLAFGVEDKLNPLLDEFTTLGFSLHDVVKKEVLRDPRVLALEVGELSHCLKILTSLKCRPRIKDDIFSRGAFRAGYELKLRVDCLRKHGLISTDAFTVLWKEPRAILYELEDIEKKIHFLLHTMKYEIVCLVDVPEYLGVNFEKQIVPRYNVIQYLRSKGGVGDELGLSDLIKPSRLKFYNLYVKPYPECETIYGRFAAHAGVRTGQDARDRTSRHPAGMWKLFKPQKFPKSAEDVLNIKACVDSLGMLESEPGGIQEAFRTSKVS